MESKSDVSAELNEQLDTCACQIIESYEELLTQRALLDKCLDQGYLNMSKARSLLGVASLSRLQIPSELEARVRIRVSENEVEKIATDFDGVDFEFKTDKYELVKANEGGESEKMPTWFGVLTPLSLKTSHKSFCRALYLIVSIGQQQTRLKSLEKRYEELMKVV